MKMSCYLRRRVATWVPFLALLAGCAAAPRAPEATAPTAVAPSPVPTLAVETKQAIKDRVRGKHTVAAKPNIEYQLMTEADEAGPPTAAQIFRAHAQRKAIERAQPSGPDAQEKSAGLQPSQWQSLGPGNVAGRIRAIAFDPRSSRRLFVGAATGGLWISEDAGDTWRPYSDFLPNLSISTMVVDASNPNVMYIGTGEASQGFVGVGVFKSTDNAATFRHIAGTNPDANPDWRFVNRLAIHPSQPSILLAALTANDFTSGAIYRSTDAGETWAKVAPMKALDIAFDPNTPSNAVAGLDDGTIAYSRDAGASWQRSAPLIAAPSGRGSTARAETAFARSQPGLVYASVDNAKGEVWRSVDGGASWMHMSTPEHLNNQGDYDNTIWVDPFDANHVVVGGLDIHRSVDGGATFLRISDRTQAPQSPHADHHALVSPPDYSPSNPVLFNGNDGGIYRTPNIRNASTSFGWVAANNGLNVTQFYSGAGRTAAGGRITGGTQDNGSIVLSNGLWRFWEGGDGGYGAVDPASDAVMYGSIYYLAIFRSTNGGNTRTYICNGITEAFTPESNPERYCGSGTTQRANFIAPFVLDPNDSSRMLAGADSLWASDNVRAGTPTWRAIKPPSMAQNYINAIAIAEGNGNIVYVGHNNGEVYRSTNALSPSPTWTRVGQGTIPARVVRRITIDHGNPNRVWVALTGFTPDNLWESADGGTTWRSITANLPSAPIFDLKRHPTRAQWLYAATSVGVFTSEDGGASWSTTNEGPANIRVRELFWLDDRTLGAATFGRGMYKVSVPGDGPANYQDLWWSGLAENGWGMSLTQHGSMIFGAFFIYDAQGLPLWVVMPGGSWNAGFTTFSGSLYIPSGPWFGAYDASRHSVGSPVGSATIAFTNANNATLSYTINGVSGQKNISRMLYGPPDATPVATYGDMWWGGTSQNGWGVAISQQYRTLFSVWYTYDQAGRTVWYVVPSGAWTSATTFTGTAYRTTGSAWIGVPYNPGALNQVPVGTVTFDFRDRDNATMSYTVDGVTQSKAITRLPF
jgi:photosystem II stability/assembly factor-like uncharacterized protein